MSAVVSFYGLPETRKMIAEYSDKELTNKMRRASRAGIAEFRTELRAEASSGQFPHSFRKTKSKSTTRGGSSGREIEASVRPSSPLFNIFGPGAGAHMIGGGTTTQVGAGGRARKVRGGRRTSGMLSGPQGSSTWDAGGRKRPGAFFARGPVRHPGMASRPLLVPSFERRVARAEDVVANAIFGHSVGGVVGE